MNYTSTLAKYLRARLGVYPQSGALKDASLSKGIVFIVNIRLGCKYLAVKNALTYNSLVVMATVKSSRTKAPKLYIIKLFFVIVDA